MITLTVRFPNHTTTEVILPETPARGDRLVLDGQTWVCGPRYWLSPSCAGPPCEIDVTPFARPGVPDD